jgi:hypothetical protein
MQLLWRREELRSSTRQQHHPFFQLPVYGIAVAAVFVCVCAHQRKESHTIRTAFYSGMFFPRPKTLGLDCCTSIDGTCTSTFVRWQQPLGFGC